MKSLFFLAVLSTFCVGATWPDTPAAAPSSSAASSPRILNVKPKVEVSQDPETGIRIRVLLAGKGPAAGEKIEPGRLVCLEPLGLDANSRHSFDVRYPSTFEDFFEEGGKLFFAMPPADVGITLFVLPEDGPIIKFRTVIESTGKKDPEPDLVDDQDENQDDDQQGGNVSAERVRGVLVVTQKGEADLDANALNKSETWRNIKSIIETDKAFWMDSDQDRAKPYKALFKNRLPAVLLFDENDNLIEVKRLPKTEDEFRKLFK